jgi:hypothetical protein
MWQVYAYLARDLIESKRRDADRTRAGQRPAAKVQRGSLVHRILPGRGHR